MANTTSYYYDFHYPLQFVNLMLELLGRQQDSTTAQPVDSGDREWFSQPRVSKDSTTEVITTTFRLPLSVSEISLEILRMPCKAEVWYQDRSNNWRPVLDSQRNPLSVMVSRSDTKSWYKFSARCYPIVAKQVQIRVTRSPDPVLASTPYPVGIRNTLLRRNVYERSAAGPSFEDEVDILGNVVSKTVRDWNAAAAIDNDYTTYWRSAPQPDPSAVVSLYLDVRTDTGAPQVIDRLYLDPVYTGQDLNIYYSSDMTVGTRKLSPATLLPSTDEGTEWHPQVGRRDTAVGNGMSSYRWPLRIGPQSSQDAWVGVEWTPDFASATANLAHNPVLFEMADPVTDGFKPTLYYDPGSRRFGLEFDSSYNTLLYTTPPLSQDWSAGETVRVRAGWRYTPDRTVVITVVNQRGQTLTELVATPGDLPASIVLTGDAGFSNVRGTIRNLVVNLESYEASSSDFLANPTIYCDPDPTIPDENGQRPSTSLDNAVYAATFVSREHGCGGPDDSHYDDKEWTPIWRNYAATKGMLYFPQPVGMKFLKLEFTNLTEEPYPIYEAGIDVLYKVFPVSVIQQSTVGTRTYTGSGGFLGLGTFISTNGVRSVNWLNASSVAAAVGSIFGAKVPPVVISTGTPYVSQVIPNSSPALVQDSQRLEVASSFVYAREAIQPYVLAADKYNTTIKAEGLQAIQDYVTVPWQEIEAANPGVITKVKSTGTVPMRGTDWWIYPGQQLRIPAAVMTKLTDTSTVTERKFTTERRVRFVTTSVHRYETRVLRRDAAIAYFAGVREVQPYTASYIPGEDQPVFDFPIYDPVQWTYTNVVQAVDDLGNPFGPIGVDVPGAVALASKSLQTQSDFVKVDVDYRDSGLLKSDPIWAIPDDGGAVVGDEKLSPYFGVLPGYLDGGTATGGTTTTLVDSSKSWRTNVFAGKMLAVTNGTNTDTFWTVLSNTATTITITGTAPVAFNSTSVYEVRGVLLGNWSDTISAWNDPATMWGSAHGVVSLAVSNDRRYQGNRVVTFTRAADVASSLSGGGEAGIVVRQRTNFVPGALARVGATFYRPTNTEQILLTGTATGGTTTTLVDSGQSWTANQYRGKRLVITGGGGAGQIATITGNTSTALTVGAMAVAPNSSSTYRIIDGNVYRLRLTRASDNVEIYSEDFAPDAGRWVDRITNFFEIPPTLVNGGFNTDLATWTGGGTATWTRDASVGRTGTGSAKVTTNGTVSTFTTEKMLVFLDETVHCSAWVRWEGLASTSPGQPVLSVKAVYYSDNTVIATHRLEGGVVTDPVTNQSEWVPLGGSLFVPSGLGVTHVAFQVAVENAASGGKIWVDDVTADVPGASRQTYDASLTLVGTKEETVHVSDLYTQIAPIRYFVRLGGLGSYRHEVTDLRHVKSTTTVTSSTPVNDIALTTVVLSSKAFAFGCTAVPHYLR